MIQEGSSRFPEFHLVVNYQDSKYWTGIQLLEASPALKMVVPIHCLFVEYGLFVRKAIRRYNSCQSLCSLSRGRGETFLDHVRNIYEQFKWIYDTPLPQLASTLLSVKSEQSKFPKSFRMTASQPFLPFLHWSQLRCCFRPGFNKAPGRDCSPQSTRSTAGSSHAGRGCCNARVAIVS
jgi:hypothetical protein